LKKYKFYYIIAVMKNIRTYIKSLTDEIKPKSLLISVLGSTVLAFGLYNIHSAADVTEGGTLGLTLLFENLFGISPGIAGFILNTACYILGIKTLGKKFLVYSVISTGGFSISYGIFEQFPRIYPDISSYPLIAAILGAAFVGLGVGLCVRMGGAPCGDDALAMSISEKIKIKIQWVYLISDLSVLLLSLIYIPFTKIVYSLLSVVISGQIIGFIADFRRKKTE